MTTLNECDKRKATREALLSSAKELFTQRGYAAVSTRELADLAGVNLGAIQYHFGSKAKLFVETVRELMSERKVSIDACCSATLPQSAKDATAALMRFISTVLYDMCHPQGPDACRMMHREIHGSASEDPELFEPLVCSVTDEFIKPLDDYLVSLLTIINPSLSERERWMVVHSIIGQCSYYCTHKPFTERLRGEDFTVGKTIREVANHISELTLRGIGLSDEVIEEARAQFEEELNE